MQDKINTLVETYLCVCVCRGRGVFLVFKIFSFGSTFPYLCESYYVEFLKMPNMGNYKKK